MSESDSDTDPPWPRLGEPAFVVQGYRTNGRDPVKYAVERWEVAGCDPWRVLLLDVRALGCAFQFRARGEVYRTEAEAERERVRLSVVEGKREVTEDA